MPEALAAPKRSQEPRKRSAPSKFAALRSRLWAARRSTRAKLFVVFALAVSIGVPVNALYLQDARHPAPLFQAAVAPPEPARHAQATSSAAAAPQRQAAHAAGKAEPAKPETKKAEGAKPAQGLDQIAQLLGVGAAKTESKGTPAKPAPTKPATPKAAHEKDSSAKAAKAKAAPAKKDAAVKDAATKKAPGKPETAQKPVDKSVVFAQRALSKLGFALHQDGVYGGTTREALEKFERANGMPAKGELTPKLLKLLSQRSGVAMR